MGVPITFLDRHNPEQFDIVGIDRYVADNPNYGHRFMVNGKETYARILIKRRIR
ncbi:MAG: adenine-specific methyltransferase EcoRI family protein [Firmicutes bacterium]|nr:adenine-specific methyltransferase EcoRI family protein [Bacillota bacterium]